MKSSLRFRPRTRPAQELERVSLFDLEIERQTWSSFMQSAWITLAMGPVGFALLNTLFSNQHHHFRKTIIISFFILLGSVFVALLAGGYLGFIRHFFGQWMSQASIGKIRLVAHLPNLLFFGLILCTYGNPIEAIHDIQQSPEGAFLFLVPLVGFELWSLDFHAKIQKKKAGREAVERYF